MKKEKRVVNQQKLDELLEYSKDIYSNISLIKMFCEQKKEVDDFYQILPILKMTQNMSDILYAEMINLKGT